jgi:hypothetical protein
MTDRIATPADGAPHHVLAASGLADDRTRVLKHGDTFAVFDHSGDVKPGDLGEEGLYAALVFLLVQACLGLAISGPDRHVSFTRPRLPASLGELRIHNLEVAGATVDLLLVRHENDVGVNVLHRDGDVQVTVVK